MNRICGIYMIGTPSGRVYVGSSIDCVAREKQHRAALMKGRHKNPILQNAANKYGVAALTFVVVELCAADVRLIREQAFIDSVPADICINVARFAGGGSGAHGAETRRRMSAARKGRAHSTEHRAALRESLNSPEVRERISKGLRGKPRRAEHVQKLAAIRQGSVRRDNKSGYCGVGAHGPNWRATLSSKGERRALGTYKTPELAYAMRLVYLAALPPGGV